MRALFFVMVLSFIAATGQPRAPAAEVQRSNLAEWRELPVANIRNIEFDLSGKLTFVADGITYEYATRHTSDLPTKIAMCRAVIDYCRHAKSLKVLVGLSSPDSVTYITSVILTFDRLQ